MSPKNLIFQEFLPRCYVYFSMFWVIRDVDVPNYDILEWQVHSLNSKKYHLNWNYYYEREAGCSRQESGWTPDITLLLWKKRTGMRKLPKLPILSKNASNQSCSKLNFLQKKSRGAYIYQNGVELGGSKECYVQVYSLYGSTLLKLWTI